MSLSEIETAIRRASFADEKLTAAGYCRYSAIKMKRIARSADATRPTCKVEFLVYGSGEAVHYALSITAGGEVTVLNLVKTALFPHYIGSLNKAPGLLPNMKVTRFVK